MKVIVGSLKDNKYNDRYLSTMTSLFANTLSHVNASNDTHSAHKTIPHKH